jgi:phosphoribosyl-AMP cyclohydrolase
VNATNRTDPKWLEEGTDLSLDFGKLRKVAQSSESVLPVVVQDADSQQVLLLGYANRGALQHTIDHQVATFWSTSRNDLWIKGATSGDYLQIVEIRVNCEQNSLLYLVKPLGRGACHTRDATGKPRRCCYYRKIRAGQLEFVNDNDQEKRISPA